MHLNAEAPGHRKNGRDVFLSGLLLLTATEAAAAVATAAGGTPAGGAPAGVSTSRSRRTQ